MTSPLPAEEGGREPYNDHACANCGALLSRHAEYRWCPGQNGEFASRPASVVGDASEGEAERYAKLVRVGYGEESNLAVAYINTLASLRSTRAALEEARKDAERLNWFEANGIEIQNTAAEPEWYLRFVDRGRGTDDDLHAESIREAIDVARSRAIPSQESTKV